MPFFTMGPQFLTEEPVDLYELSYYHNWKECDGRYWGD